MAILTFLLYPGLPFKHNAVMLTDNNGQQQFFSYNSITHKWIMEDTDPYEARSSRDDLSDWFRDTWAHQFGPMYRSNACVVSNPRELAPELPKDQVTIELNTQEYDKIQAYFTHAQKQVTEQRWGYSIWARTARDGKQLKSCASSTQELLETLQCPNATLAKKLSLFEYWVSVTPTRVHERAHTIAKARQDPPAVLLAKPWKPPVTAGLLSKLSVLKLLTPPQTTAAALPLTNYRYN